MALAHTGRQSGFWWRAADPIPARPLSLDPIAGLPPVPTAAPADLGAVRPAELGDPPHDLARLPAGGPDDRVHRRQIAPPMLRTAPALAGTANAPDTGHARHGRRARAGGRIGLIAAGLAGALMFAGFTGFGRTVQPSIPLARQADMLLAGAGLAVNEVSVFGHTQTLESEIFRALGATDGSLLTLDVVAARKRVEALAWIETADIVRILPDKLHVRVRERKPFAVWHDGETNRLVDRTGRILAVLGTRTPDGLPRIAGRGAPSAAAELLDALDRHPMLRDRVTVAHRLGGRRWDLDLENGPRVRLPAGPVGPSLARLAHLEQAHAAIGATGQVVDLRLADRIAVGWAADWSVDRAQAEPAQTAAGRL